jgi:hypothetical protein
MPCAERRRLMELYSKATRDLWQTIEALGDTAIAYELDVFNRAWEHGENALRHCSDIRQQIYSHVHRHRCALVLPKK